MYEHDRPHRNVITIRQTDVAEPPEDEEEKLGIVGKSILFTVITLWFVLSICLIIRNWNGV